jgi:hypothetical protein
MFFFKISSKNQKNISLQNYLIENIGDGLILPKGSPWRLRFWLVVVFVDIMNLYMKKKENSCEIIL